MAAAQKCVELKVDYVEIDVRTSKDGVFYILHDRTLDRTTHFWAVQTMLYLKILRSLAPPLAASPERLAAQGVRSKRPNQNSKKVRGQNRWM